MRSTLLTLLLLCVLPFTSKAQKLEFEGEFLLFREAKTKQPVLIVNDSLVYKGFAMKRIAFKHTEYPAKLQEYKFFNIGSKTYLVHEGCGPVLEYRNDSIVRIDNSFLHQNQYKASHFIYNKEIYFFGGYGLFTTKNILTKFNFNTGEWIEVQTYGVSEEQTRSGAFSFVKKNNFYVFGGDKKDLTKLPKGKLLDNKLWGLNLTTMKWFCGGKHNIVDNLINIRGLFYDNEKLYLLSNTVTSINFFLNKVEVLQSEHFESIYSCYKEGTQIIGVFGIDGKSTKYCKVININRIIGKKLKTTDFISPIEQNNSLMYFYSIIFLAFISLLLIFRKRIFNILKPYNGFIYYSSKQIFVYKGRPISIFEEHEKVILLYLLDHLNQYVSLNELNQLFEKNNHPETISATVKRREQAVSGLLVKVSKITRMEENELLLEFKNSEDKRIKDILLLPNLLKKGD